jgi:hypothetical protein
MQPPDCGETYKVGVGCLNELLLGAVTDASVCKWVSRACRRVRVGVEAAYRQRRSPPTPG